MIAILTLLLLAQAAPPAGSDAEPSVDFVCPMDPDVRARGPAKCPRCGMRLEAGIPHPREYDVELRTAPRALRSGQPVELSFQVFDPKTKAPVKDFEIVHERIFHLFVVGADLEFFLHEHPELGSDGIFRYRTVLPNPGHYRVLADFYPSGGTPQLIPKSLIVAGSGAKAEPLPAADSGPKRGPNLEVSLATEPPQPIAGQKTLLFFRLKGAAGLEPYLGALGHLLAASGDLIDMIHSHPAFPETYDTSEFRQVQFNVIFPRAGMYRVWVQFQNEGQVNTLAFTVPVTELR